MGGSTWKSQQRRSFNFRVGGGRASSTAAGRLTLSVCVANPATVKTPTFQEL